jgi:hypothetical protein
VVIGGSVVVVFSNIMSNGTGRRGVAVARTRLENPGECFNLADVASKEKISIDNT